MIRDPLQRLVHLFATETNPHQLVLRVVSETSVLEEARRLSHYLLDANADSDGRIIEGCRQFKIPTEFFWERLQLLARILNLIPYDQNYYELLGIGPQANQHEIKQAYRRLSFASHPDANPNDPDAAERFRNLQHAYQVLSHDPLRRRYDLNQKEHLWEEAADMPGGTAGPAWWGKWRRAWPVALLIMLLMATTFVVDYSQWQTERYYASLKALPPRVAPNASKPTASISGQPGGETAPSVASLPAVPSSESRKPSLNPETSRADFERPISIVSNPPTARSGQDEKSSNPVPSSNLEPSFHPAGNQDDVYVRPEPKRHEAPKESEPAPLPNEGAARKETSLQNTMESSREATPAAVKPAPPQAVATAEATPKTPPPASPPAPRDPLAPGKGQESRHRTDVKQAETTPAHSAEERPLPAKKPPHGPEVDGFAPIDNLDHEIRMFLSRYTSTYERRDISAFLRFFEANAIENGRPIQELVPIYQANFRRAEKLRYRIKVGRWEMGQGEVMVDGSFSLAVQFEQEAPVESKGSIHLTLVRRNADFGVKRLDYIFKESRKTSE